MTGACTYVLVLWAAMIFALERKTAESYRLWYIDSTLHLARTFSLLDPWRSLGPCLLGSCSCQPGSFACQPRPDNMNYVLELRVTDCITFHFILLSYCPYTRTILRIDSRDFCLCQREIRSSKGYLALTRNKVRFSLLQDNKCKSIFYKP